MRVFPQSDNGKDIVGVFERLFYRYVNLRLHLWSKIDDIDHERDMFTVHTSGPVSYTHLDVYKRQSLPIVKKMSGLLRSYIRK